MSNALNDAAKGLNKTPQTAKARPDQVKNDAGGYVFGVSDQSRLERFLILGVTGGTYYVGEADHATGNVKFLADFISRDEAAVLETVVDVSVNGRAYKQGQILFAMAMLIAEGKNKQAVKAEFNKVVRTGTHLYELMNYLTSLGTGWGRAKRDIIASWFDKDADKLAYQMVKYRSRRFDKQTWTYRDVMRLSHPKNVNTSVADFALGKSHDSIDDLRVIEGFKKMQKATSVENVVQLLKQYEMLSWETIPTQFLKNVVVWKTLFSNGQLRGQALIRNITRLARYGAFQDLTFAMQYAEALTDQKMIEQTRLHPINFLNASVVYTDGQIQRGDWGYEQRVKDWTTESVILDALNEGFHQSFKTIKPAGKRTMLALDVSGSMSAKASGLDLSCAQVSAAMSMAIARTEPAHIIRGFTSSGNGYGWGGQNSALADLGISARTDLATAMRNVQRHNWGGTDCSLPMRWALENKVEIDTFVVITDNDTWAGKIHPFQALKEYRRKTGINARMAVLGVQATDFTIADPSDAGMMDFVGFDSNAPGVLADFSGGRL